MPGECPICGPTFIGRCPHVPREPSVDFGDPEPLTPMQLARVASAIRSVGLPKPSTRRQRSTALADRIADLERALAASREPMPCGHPAACVVSSREGTCSCAWCDEVAALRADLDAAQRCLRATLADLPCEHPGACLTTDAGGSYCGWCADRAHAYALRDVAIRERDAARDAQVEADEENWRNRDALDERDAALADANLRTALWSRGALPLPEPWGCWMPEGWPTASAAPRWVQLRHVQDRWLWEGALDHKRVTGGSDPDPLVCLRAAEAWLAERGGAE